MAENKPDTERRSSYINLRCPRLWLIYSRSFPINCGPSSLVWAAHQCAEYYAPSRLERFGSIFSDFALDEETDLMLQRFAVAVKGQ